MLWFPERILRKRILEWTLNRVKYVRWAETWFYLYVVGDSELFGALPCVMMGLFILVIVCVIGQQDNTFRQSCISCALHILPLAALMSAWWQDDSVISIPLPFFYFCRSFTALKVWSFMFIFFIWTLLGGAWSVGKKGRPFSQRFLNARKFESLHTSPPRLKRCSYYL